MATRTVDTARSPRTGSLLIACVAGHGTATHPYFASETLTRGHEAARNLADVIHFLCALHGRHPGIVDHAATRTVEPAGRAWLGSAAEASATSLSSGASPRPQGRGSTPSRLAAASSTVRIAAQSTAKAKAAPSAQPRRSDWASVASALRWATIAVSLPVAPGVLGIGPAATASRVR